jgi:hypothetical protein
MHTGRWPRVHSVESQWIASLCACLRRYRWAGHPEWERLSARIDFHLERLAESGELRKVSYGYEPTGLALKALEDTEEQDRRHRESIKVQIGLGFLAFVTAVMAAAQAGLVKLSTFVDLTTPTEETGRPSGEGR